MKNIRSRSGIHATTPQRAISEQKDDTSTDESVDEFNNETESEEEIEDEEPYSENFETLHRSQKLHSVPRTPQQPKKQTKNASPLPLTQNLINSDSNKCYFCYILIGLIIGILIATTYSIRTPKGKVCSFETFKQKYQQESSDLWNTLTYGVESILNETVPNPAVYLFLHHGGQHVLQLIENIALHSSGCFGKEMLPVHMKSDDFISAAGIGDDYGHVIVEYKNRIKEGNVILIANLNDIPAEAARALHAICDTYSPIAKDVVIYLTLTVERNKNGTADSIAFDTLTELWGSNLNDNELDALITRVTDQTIFLKT